MWWRQFGTRLGYWSDVSIRDRMGVLSVVAPAPVEADGVRFPFHPYEIVYPVLIQS